MSYVGELVNVWSAGWSTGAACEGGREVKEERERRREDEAQQKAITDTTSNQIRYRVRSDLVRSVTYATYVPLPTMGIPSYAHGPHTYMNHT